MAVLIMAVPMSVVLTVALMAPHSANADSTQTSNANPTVQVPAGYVLVPSNGSACVSPAAASVGEDQQVKSVAVVSSVVPYSYNNVTNQTSTETNTSSTVINTKTINKSYTDSFNKMIDSQNGNASNNGNGSFNGNGSGNGNNNGNNRDNITTTTTATSTNVNTTTNTNNTSNTNNSNNVNSTVDNDPTVNALVGIVNSLNNNSI